MSLIKIRRIATLNGEDRRDGKDFRAAGDATTRKFNPNDIVEWRDAHGRHNSAFYVRENGDRVTVSIEKNGHGGGLEIPKEWITNSHAADACEDSAELRVVHAKGIGKWWVEPNLSRFNDTEREQTHKGRKEFPDREAAMKYARGTGKTFIVNDACEDSGEPNNDADLRAALSKMADSPALGC